jgi:hypothetical protein
MTTFTDAFRANFNGDETAPAFGNLGDLFLFDNFGDKAIWLEDGSGNRLATSPQGFNLPFTGPTWHIAATADFDSVGAPNSDLLWVNDNGALALWQSNGSNVNSFPGNENQENLPNPGAGWHVALTTPTGGLPGTGLANDFDGNTAADILFQHTSGLLAIWEFESANPANPLAGAPVIKQDGLLNVDQNPGSTWHVAATGDIDGGGINASAGIAFQNSVTNDIAVWEHPTEVNGQIHFDIQSNLPNPGPGWHVVGMGNTTEDGFNVGQDLVLQNDNGAIAIWQLAVTGNQVVRDGTQPNGFNLGNPGSSWHVVGVRDMNADGKADLLLQNDNGAAAVWDNIQANGTHDGFNFNPQPNPGVLDWHIV